MTDFYLEDQNTINLAANDPSRLLRFGYPETWIPPANIQNQGSGSIWFRVDQKPAVVGAPDAARLPSGWAYNGLEFLTQIDIVADSPATVVIVLCDILRP